MLYIRNDSLEYVSYDDTSLIVLNPVSGETFVFNETGAQIIALLKSIMSLDEICRAMLEMYSGSEPQIREEIIAFLECTIDEGIISVRQLN